MSTPYMDPSGIDDLQKIRADITRVDEQLLSLLSERRRLSRAVAATKDLNTAVIRDPGREEDLLVNLVQKGRQKGLDAHLVTRVFHEIIDDSVRIQQEYFQHALNDSKPVLRVAIVGESTSLDAAAAHKYLSRQSEPVIMVPCEHYAQVIQCVEKNEADMGLLPIENTLSGGNGEIYDLLLQTSLQLIGEEKVEQIPGKVYVRYLVVARERFEVDLRIPCKTTLVMATYHRAGALLESLQIFRDFEINLSKLESRPIVGNPWEELFYVDFDGNLSDPTIQEAVHRLTKVTRFLKVLGCYPHSDLQKTIPPPKRLRVGKKTESVPNHTQSEQARLSFQIRGISLGGSDPLYIAGPDSFVSMSTFSRFARLAKESGINLLRMGCSGSLEDLSTLHNVQEADLLMAREVADGFGMAILSEIHSIDRIDLMSRYMDVLQVGSWNMRNKPLLTELGRQPVPILLYRNTASGNDEFLEAVDWIRQGGNQQVILCDAGMKRFDASTRTSIDPAIVYDLFIRSGLPILVDLRYAGHQQEHRMVLARALQALPLQGFLFSLDANRLSSDQGLRETMEEVTQLIDLSESVSIRPSSL